MIEKKWISKEEAKEMFPDSETVKPAQPLSILGLEGYETYKIDDNTIGVRPICISVKQKYPKPQETVIVSDGMRIQNLKHQKFYLEKFFPWTTAHPDEITDEIALEKLEEVLIRLRDIKAYVKEQKERMEAIYPNETQGYLVLNYLYKNLLGFVKEGDYE